MGMKLLGGDCDLVEGVGGWGGLQLCYNHAESANLAVPLLIVMESRGGRERV